MGKINVKQFGVLHPYVFYHNDMDGKCAAWLLHEHFNKMHIPNSPSDYQHYCYDGNMKLGSINKNTVVYIVDLSFTKSTYGTLLDICEKAAAVIWIDHHDSSIDLITKYHPELLEIENLFVFVNKGACGALLTKIYLETDYLSYVHPLEDNYQKFKDTTSPKFNINWFDPKQFEVLSIIAGKNEHSPFVDLRIGDSTRTVEFDICLYIDKYLEMIDDHDRYCLRNPNTRAFIKGTDVENTSIVYKSIDNKIEFNSEFWGYLDATCDDYIHDGELIIKYTTKKNRDELSQCFEYIDPETGCKIICKNDRGDSYNFLGLYDLYDAVCLFRYDGKVGRWFYSIYNRADKTFNCAEFCQKFGGGGHQHAAGFSSDKLIFDIS